MSTINTVNETDVQDDARVVERKDGVAGVDRMWDSQWINVVNDATTPPPAELGEGDGRG